MVYSLIWHVIGGKKVQQYYRQVADVGGVEGGSGGVGLQFP